MPSDVRLTYRANANAKDEVHAAIFKAVQDTFEKDIKKEAVRCSPTRKVKRKYKVKGKWIPGGTNRRSIDTTVSNVGRGVFAALFTQSGYGGYLELGHRVRVSVRNATMRWVKGLRTLRDTSGQTYGFVQGRPYLYPAFNMYVGKLAERVKTLLGGKR